MKEYLWEEYRQKPMSDIDAIIFDTIKEVEVVASVNKHL